MCVRACVRVRVCFTTQQKIPYLVQKGRINRYFGKRKVSKWPPSSTARAIFKNRGKPESYCRSIIKLILISSRLLITGCLAKYSAEKVISISFNVMQICERSPWFVNRRVKYWAFFFSFPSTENKHWSKKFWFYICKPKQLNWTCVFVWDP